MRRTARRAFRIALRPARRILRATRRAVRRVRRATRRDARRARRFARLACLFTRAIFILLNEFVPMRQFSVAFGTVTAVDSLAATMP